jgi:hypothetical protein
MAAEGPLTRIEPMTADWLKPLDSFRSEFRDVARSYPKLFYARLIAPVVPHETWRFILGNKRYLRYPERPLDGDYVAQYCLYADANSDEIMCKHALQQFDSLSIRAVGAIREIPSEIRELLNLSNIMDSGALDWLDVIDTLAARPAAHGQVKGFARDQFRVLRNDADSTSPVLVPLMAYKALADSFPPDAFPHRWLAVVSPDIATCSIAAIEEMLRELPDPASDFTISTWIDKDGCKTTWTVHDPDIVAALQDSYGTPATKYEHEGYGVSGTILIERLDDIPPGAAHAHSYHQLIAQILNRLFSPDLTGMKIEKEINEGRKRIDITFDNIAASGFFHDLKVAHHIKCPVIFVECKNYANDPANPELDQLQGRFGQQRGEFGIMVCREIADRKTMILRSRDIVNAHRGYVIVLTDADLKSLWNLRAASNNAGFYQFLRDRMNELIL